MVGREVDETENTLPPLYSPRTDAMPRRHPEFYLERGNMTIQVKDTLFRISDIKFWTHSDFFNIASRANGKDLQTTLDEKARGYATDPNHIWVLQDVEVEEFARLLWILYPPDHGRCRAKTIYDWKSILKLADMWKFRDVYNLAVRKLSQLPLVPVEKIGLMHRHHIRKEWVLDALVALVTQPTFPSYFDTQVIGLEMTTQLAHAREEYRAALIRPTSYATATVRRVFGLRDDLGVPSSWEANVPIN